MNLLEIASFFAGELWVNDVQIIGWTKVRNGVVFALSDYLYTEHIEPSLQAIPRDYKKQQMSNEISDDKITSTTAAPTTTTLTILILVI